MPLRANVAKKTAPQKCNFSEKEAKVESQLKQAQAEVQSKTPLLAKEGADQPQVGGVVIICFCRSLITKIWVLLWCGSYRATISLGVKYTWGFAADGATARLSADARAASTEKRTRGAPVGW